MNAASRFLVVILGGVYVIGLLIINVDLGRYGLISLNLARPEYIMAGALWAFLCLCTLGAGMFLFEVIRSMRSMSGVLWGLLIIAVDYIPRNIEYNGIGVIGRKGPHFTACVLTVPYTPGVGVFRPKHHPWTLKLVAILTSLKSEQRNYSSPKSNDDRDNFGPFYWRLFGVLFGAVLLWVSGWIIYYWRGGRYIFALTILGFYIGGVLIAFAF